MKIIISLYLYWPESVHPSFLKLPFSIECGAMYSLFGQERTHHASKSCLVRHVTRFGNI